MLLCVGEDVIEGIRGRLADDVDLLCSSSTVQKKTLMVSSVRNCPCVTKGGINTSTSVGEMLICTAFSFPGTSPCIDRINLRQADLAAIDPC